MRYKTFHTEEREEQDYENTYSDHSQCSIKNQTLQTTVSKHNIERKLCMCFMHNSVLKELSQIQTHTWTLNYAETVTELSLYVLSICERLVHWGNWSQSQVSQEQCKNIHSAPSRLGKSWAGARLFTQPQ